MTPMRWLCVCEGGNVRSVALAMALKDAGQDAIACGWRHAGPDTLRTLSGWADIVVVMQAVFAQKMEDVKGFDPRKLIILDVGPDVYGTPMHGGLRAYLRGVVEDWKGKRFELQSALGHRLPLAAP